MIDRSALDDPNQEAYVSEVHVVPHESGEGWQVIDSRAPGRAYNDSAWDTKEDAEIRARKILGDHQAGGQLIVHKKDSTVQSNVRVDYAG